MSNNGWTQAQEWLKENAADWTLVRTESRLRAADRVGGPTVRWCDVVLVKTIYVEAHGPATETAQGDGASIIEAVKAALNFLG